MFSSEVKKTERKKTLMARGHDTGREFITRDDDTRSDAMK